MLACRVCGAPLEGVTFVRNLQETMDELGLRLPRLDPHLPAVQAPRARPRLPPRRETRLPVIERSDRPARRGRVPRGRREGGRRLARARARGRPQRADPLLLLRRAVRDVPEGRPRRTRVRRGAARASRSTRASSARRASPPTSRSSTPTGSCTRSCATPKDGPLRRATWDEALDRVGLGDPTDPADLRQRRLRRVLGLLARHRGHLPDGQVRARRPAVQARRLQRASVHGERRRREQEGVRDRPRGEPVVGHVRHAGDPGRRRERRRVLPGDDPLRVGRPGPRREADHGRSARDAAGAHGRPPRAAAPGHRQRVLQRRPARVRARGLARRGLHRGAHRRVGGRARGRAQLHARAGRRDLRDRPGARRAGRARVGNGRARDGVPRPRDRAPGAGRGERAVDHQPRARHRPDRRARQGLRDDHGPGQRPGRARARAEDRPAAGGARHREPRAPRVHLGVLGDRRGRPAPRRRLGGRAGPPDRGRRRSAGCSGSATTRSSRCRTRRGSRGDYGELEFHVQLDFFLSETAARADVVLPVATWAEEGGCTTNAEGRVVLRHRAADPPGEARNDWRVDLRARGAPGRRGEVRVRVARRTSSRSSAARPRAASRTTRGSPTTGSRRAGGCSGRSPPRTIPAPPGCSRSASTSPTARRGSTSCSGASRPSRSTRSTRSA